MTGEYWAFHFVCRSVSRDFLLGILNDLPFEGFEEQEEILIGYMQVENLTPDFEQYLESLPGMLEWQKEKVSSENWNSAWETNFEPVVIGTFCAIRAEFHKPVGQTKYEIIIQPKMTFGTGHHQTTRLMIENMHGIDFKGKKVLDYGCGTGILGILSEIMSASFLAYVDNDELAIENTIENRKINNCEGNAIFHGSLPELAGKSFDVLLANINESVLMESAEDLKNQAETGAILLISGILKDQFPAIDQKYQSTGWVLQSFRILDEWCCTTYQLL